MLWCSTDRIQKEIHIYCELSEFIVQRCGLRKYFRSHRDNAIISTQAIHGTTAIILWELKHFFPFSHETRVFACASCPLKSDERIMSHALQNWGRYVLTCRDVVHFFLSILSGNSRQRNDIHIQELQKESYVAVPPQISSLLITGCEDMVLIQRFTCRNKSKDFLGNLEIWPTNHHVKHVTVLQDLQRINLCDHHFAFRCWEIWDPFHWYGLSLIPAWISNHMHSEVPDKITYLFLKFSGATAEV